MIALWSYSSAQVKVRDYQNRMKVIGCLVTYLLLIPQTVTK